MDLAFSHPLDQTSQQCLDNHCMLPSDFWQ